METGFVTIGHSDRTLDELMDMLREARVDLVVDVRSFPRSRSNPVFNIENLPSSLAQRQIAYDHYPDLGGRRPKQTSVDPDLNALWRVGSFHNYADYALGGTFGAAFDALIAVGRARRVAIMCAEAVWWRCHRRIVADYLLLNGHRVDHLMAPGRSDAATPTPGAKRRPDGKLIYPAPA